MTRLPVRRPVALLVTLLAMLTLFRGGNGADIFKKKEKLALAFLAGMVFGQQGRQGSYAVPVPWPMQSGQQILPLPLPIPIGNFGGGGGGGHAPPPKKVVHNLVKHHHHIGKPKSPSVEHIEGWPKGGGWPKYPSGSLSAPAKFGGSSDFHGGKGFGASTISLAEAKLGSGSPFVGLGRGLHSGFDGLSSGSSGFDKFALSSLGGSDFGDKFSIGDWDDLHGSESSPIGNFHNRFGAGFPSFPDGGFSGHGGYDLHGGFSSFGLGNQLGFPGSPVTLLDNDSGARGYDKDTVAALRELLAKSESGPLKNHPDEDHIDFRSIAHSPVFSKSMSSSSSSLSSSISGSRPLLQKPPQVKS